MKPKVIESEVTKGTGDRAEERIKKWLLERSYEAKLTALLMYNLSFSDAGTEDLFNELFDKYGADIVAMAETPAGDLKPDELVATGYAAQTMVWANNY